MKVRITLTEEALGSSPSNEDLLGTYIKGISVALELVNESPTIDAVPVVRCKECKHSSYDEIYGNRWCNSYSGCRKVKNDDFCSYGERKEGAE